MSTIEEIQAELRALTEQEVRNSHLKLLLIFIFIFILFNFNIHILY